MLKKFAIFSSFLDASQHENFNETHNNIIENIEDQTSELYQIDTNSGSVLKNRTPRTECFLFWKPRKNICFNFISFNGINHPKFVTLRKKTKEQKNIKLKNQYKLW